MKFNVKRLWKLKTVVLILGIVNYLSINAHPIKSTGHNFESYNLKMIYPQDIYFVI